MPYLSDLVQSITPIAAGYTGGQLAGTQAGIQQNQQNLQNSLAVQQVVNKKAQEDRAYELMKKDQDIQQYRDYEALFANTNWVASTREANPGLLQTHLEAANTLAQRLGLPPITLTAPKTPSTAGAGTPLPSVTPPAAQRRITPVIPLPAGIAGPAAPPGSLSTPEGTMVPAPVPFAPGQFVTPYGLRTQAELQGGAPTPGGRITQVRPSANVLPPSRTQVPTLDEKIFGPGANQIVAPLLGASSTTTPTPQGSMSGFSQMAQKTVSALDKAFASLGDRPNRENLIQQRIGQGFPRDAAEKYADGIVSDWDNRFDKAFLQVKAPLDVQGTIAEIEQKLATTDYTKNLKGQIALTNTLAKLQIAEANRTSREGIANDNRLASNTRAAELLGYRERFAQGKAKSDDWKGYQRTLTNIEQELRTRNTALRNGKLVDIALLPLDQQQHVRDVWNLHVLQGMPLEQTKWITLTNGEQNVIRTNLQKLAATSTALGRIEFEKPVSQQDYENKATAGKLVSGISAEGNILYAPPTEVGTSYVAPGASTVELSSLSSQTGISVPGLEQVRKAAIGGNASWNSYLGRLPSKALRDQATKARRLGKW